MELSTEEGLARIIDLSTYADEVDKNVCARKERRSTKCLPPVCLKPEDVM